MTGTHAPTTTNMALHKNNPRTARSALMSSTLSPDRWPFRNRADDLVAWIATMNIAKRVVVAPFDWSDAVCEAYPQSGRKRVAMAESRPGFCWPAWRAFGCHFAGLG